MAGDSANVSANAIIVSQIKLRLASVRDLADSDVVVYSGPIADFTPDIFKTVLESIGVKKKRVLVSLETNGGIVESTERIAGILRHHYRTVDFVVTTYAMSAGTILVMSGDSITMDYSATLGPIDPQIRRTASNRYVPAVGYLEQYNRLVEKSRQNQLTNAELAFLLQNFDAAELYQFEQARELSIALLEEWLVKYKFKNWKVTKGTGRRVTPVMRRERAIEIAKKLNSAEDWHSHSRGISMEVLRRSLNLEVDDIGDRPELAESLASALHLMYDFRSRMGHDTFAIASPEGYHGH